MILCNINVARLLVIVNCDGSCACLAFFFMGVWRLVCPLFVLFQFVLGESAHAGFCSVVVVRVETLTKLAKGIVRHAGFVREVRREKHDAVVEWNSQEGGSKSLD